MVNGYIGGGLFSNFMSHIYTYRKMSKSAYSQIRKWR